MSDKQYLPGLVFSITTYGPVLLASNFLVLSVLGLHRSTKFPGLNSRGLTFASVDTLVYSWYYSKFTTSLSLSNLNKLFSSASFGHGTVSVVVHKLWCFISSGNIAFVPYINKKGVKFVALQTVVLWLHTVVGMTSAHFPFFSPSNIFLIDSKIRELSLSTTTFHCGWYTNAKATFVPICWQKLFEHCVVKILCVVDCYLSGYAVMTDDVLPKEFFD
jgi:hypothetical protein